MNRISLDEHYIKVAELIAERSTCRRASVGAVLVKDGVVVSTGYNGAPTGKEHCLDVGCLIVYDNEGNQHCLRTLHAELNCIIKSGFGAKGCTLYSSYFPCVECCKTIINAGITRIVYSSDYVDYNAALFEVSPLVYLIMAGIEVVKI